MSLSYTQFFLDQYPMELKQVIATALVNVCSERNNKPEPLWLSLSLGVSK